MSAAAWIFLLTFSSVNAGELSERGDVETAHRSEVVFHHVFPTCKTAQKTISGERRALAMRVEAAGINQPATGVTVGETTHFGGALKSENEKEAQ